MKRKLLSVLLVLAMALTLLPTAAFAAGEDEATVTIGEGVAQTTENHTFTATSSDVFTLLKSGDDGIEGNNKNQYGYFPAIVMPTVDDGAKANTYYILSRGQNTNGTDKTTLDTVMTEAKDNLTSGPYTYPSRDVTLANWFQVWTADQWGGANSTYWPQIGNAPVTNIVVATATESGGSTTYAYVPYVFDFSEATTPLPFTVTASTDDELNGTSMTAEALQTSVSAPATTATLGTKEIKVTGTSKWVNFPWFGTDTTEGNYVALTLKPAGDAKIKEFTVTLSDGSTKKLDSDGVLIWQFTENKSNAKIPVKVTFGDQTNTGASINYTIDCSAMTLETKGGTTEKFTVTFNSNGGSAVTSQTVDNGAKATEPADPTKSGYTFGGWYKNADCTEAFNFDTTITADITLYAKWTAVTPSTPELTFNNKTNETEVLEFAGRKLDTLGKFDVNKDTKTGKILVTGTANYLEWEAFNTAVEAEQSGYYILYRAVLPENGWDGAKVIIPGNGATKEITGFTAEDHVLDVPMHVNKDDLEKTFTVSYVFNDVTKTYTVDWSGVVLLPEVTEENGATSAVIDNNEASKMADLIANTDEEGTATTEDAPVRIAIDDSGDKTLTFTAPATNSDGNANKGHEVTLPANLTKEMATGGGSVADVKVNSGVGSVTVPSAVLPTSSAPAPVTVAIKEAIATSTTLNDKTISGVSDNTVKATISNIVDGKKGVDVTATKGTDTPLIGESNTAVLEIVINVPAAGTYTVLCVSDSTVTSFGEKTATSENGKNVIKIRSTHLTEWYPIDNSSLTSEQKTALNAITKETEPTPPTPSKNATWSTTPIGVGEGSVTVTGLTASASYVVGLEFNGAKVYANVTANALGQLAFGCQATAKVTLTDSSSNLVALNGSTVAVVANTLV